MCMWVARVTEWVSAWVNAWVGACVFVRVRMCVTH
jgi:hypothetical protein